MIRILNKASAIALVTTLLATLLGTSGSRAAAEQIFTSPLASQSGTIVPAAQPLDQDIQPVPAPATPPAIAAASLEQLVATQADPSEADSSELPSELKCLAGAIYFEARSESLEGQLAVGRVIVARTRSGRFPTSYCGVVYQHSQFSFVRGQSMPSIDAQSHLWQRAVAMAKIADAGSWQSPAEGALFFHAARVTGSGRMTRVAQIDHHVFYR